MRPTTTRNTIQLTDIQLSALLNSTEIHHTALAASTEGTVQSTEDMSLCNRLRYPSPQTRRLLYCSFTACCLLSCGGTTVGCGLHSLSDVIHAPETIKTIFTIPAFFGWVGSFSLSLVGMLHYNQETAPEQPGQNGAAIPGIPMGHPSPTLFEMGGGSIVRTTEATETNSSVGTAIRAGSVPPGYQPQAIAGLF